MKAFGLFIDASFELGRAEGVAVFVAPHLAGHYDDVSRLIDVIDEEESDVLSLETKMGKRLILHHVIA